MKKENTGGRRGRGERGRRRLTWVTEPCYAVTQSAPFRDNIYLVFCSEQLRKKNGGVVKVAVLLLAPHVERGAVYYPSPVR